MSHPAGTYLGGIRTVEDIRQRCRIDRETGCWHWGLAIVDGSPKVHFVDWNGRRRTCRGRRAAVILDRGKDVPRGYEVFPRLICQADDCVNPAHSRIGTRAEVCRYLVQSGKSKNGTKARHLREIVSRRRKLTDEQVIELRTSTESTYKLAKRFGVSQYAAWSARVGRSHKLVGVARSAFEWAHQAAGGAVAP
jgi:hypothetical protein